MKANPIVYLLSALFCLAASIQMAMAEQLNVRDFGAKGDGQTDDTAALQAALIAAARESGGGRLYIPAGNYLVSKTLVIENALGLIVEGDGSRAIGDVFSPWAHQGGRGATTNFIWTGKNGGTLLETRWVGACVFRDFSLLGRDPRHPSSPARAGNLFRAISKLGGGNMINKISDVSFYDAHVGLCMGSPDSFQNCDSDMACDFLTFCRLDEGFKAMHLQAVNYLFNFVFVLECGTAFHFQKAGNAMLNNVQLTKTDLAVWIEGAHKNAGTYLIDNMRDEGIQGRRVRVLRCDAGEQAVIHFINFDDVQWFWFKLPPDQKPIPLCEIGPGSAVIFDTSIFSGPVADLEGEENHSAELIVRESNFNYIAPQDAISANSWGYFKTIDCRRGDAGTLSGGALFPDVAKWPSLPPTVLPANEPHNAVPKREIGDAPRPAAP